jgi:putative spermidine/putrescine transport system permease protein
MVRRLNSAQSGFRTLMPKTMSALADTANPPPNLISIDKRWDRPEFWLAIADALSPYTDRNLLAAVDLGRNAAGNIEHLPADQSVNRVILVRTFWIGALVTFTCACIGFPYALIAASLIGWKRDLMLGCRTAAALDVASRPHGCLVHPAAGAGPHQRSCCSGSVWSSAPLPLIFNRTGVIIAMTHVLLPFMVLPIYSVLITIPKNLMPAAASLGAPPLRAFLRVLMPLSLRGVASGGLLVFISAIGYYITPALIGGPGDQMISSIIAFYATGTANWGMAGALGVVLLVATPAALQRLCAALRRRAREALTMPMKSPKITFATLTILFLVAPLIAILPLAFTSSVILTYPMPSWSLRWFDELFFADAWRRAIINSLIIGTGTTLLATVLGTAASLGLRNRLLFFRGSMRTLFLLPMVVPAVVLGVGMQVLLAGFGLTNSYAGVIIAHTVVAVPFVVVSVTGALAGIDYRVELAAESVNGGVKVGHWAAQK